jgi:hypothetical protein
MIKFLAKRWAKWNYIFQLEFESAKGDLNADLAKRNTNEKRKLVERLNKEAEDIDKRIAEMKVLEEQGYWLCENGHEKGDAFIPTRDGEGRTRLECNEPTKLVKLSEMTAQERYESERERNEAEKVGESKRQQANAESENVTGGDQTEKHLRGLADNARAVADKIRKL